MRGCIVSIVVLVTVLWDAAPVEAQCRRVGDHEVCIGRAHDDGGVSFGIRGGYAFDQDVGSAGVQLRIPLASFVSIAPSFDVFFDDLDAASVEGTDWQGNLDLLLRPRGLGGIYAGAGLALADVQRVDLDDVSSGTEAGWNLLVGIRGTSFAEVRLTPFAEARWTGIAGEEDFRLVLGMNIPIGR